VAVVVVVLVVVCSRWRMNFLYPSNTGCRRSDSQTRGSEECACIVLYCIVLYCMNDDGYVVVVLVIQQLCDGDVSEEA
jgi:hypothetical protein